MGLPGNRYNVYTALNGFEDSPQLLSYINVVMDVFKNEATNSYTVEAKCVNCFHQLFKGFPENRFLLVSLQGLA